MDDTKIIERLKNQLSEVQRKHAEAKTRVSQLQLRVGPTSRDLSEAKTLKVRLKDEIVRLKRLLKQYGIPETEIATIGTAREVSAA